MARKVCDICTIKKKDTRFIAQVNLPDVVLMSASKFWNAKPNRVFRVCQSCEAEFDNWT